MQSVCPICNTKYVKFGSKVKVTKMMTKPFYIRFFKDSLNMRAQTLILKLNKAKVYTLVKLEYGSGSFKNDLVFEKRNSIFGIFFRKQDNLLIWKSSLC